MDLQTGFVLGTEIMGTVAFAASGAMTAIERKMDIFGVCVLGVVTAVGGGMVRDMILGNVPGALLHPIYVEVAAVTSLAAFFAVYIKKNMHADNFKRIYDILMFAMDAIGLGIFTALGVTTGIHAGYLDNTFLLVFLGTITGVGGGLLRDMMAGVPPYIFVKHVYACASIIGALLCVFLFRRFGEVPALLLSSLTVFVIRYLAAHFHWNLPRIETNSEQ